MYAGGRAAARDNRRLPPRLRRAKRKPPMAAKTKPNSQGKSPFTLCIDIGGTGVKAIVLDAAGDPTTERQRLETPRPATPDAIMGVLPELLGKLPPFDRVSVGFPGVVIDNVTKTAPNLNGDWGDFALGAAIEKLTGKPTKVLNDAGVQGYGIIEGKGVEMVITFGTGMGCALYLDGKYVPNLELGHHPLRGKVSYEETVADHVLKEIGKKRWRKRVNRIVDQVLPIWNPRQLYLGGGNSRHIKPEALPPNVKIADNIAGLLGGIALWKHEE